jgi:hypothetical protein
MGDVTPAPCLTWFLYFLSLIIYPSDFHGSKKTPRTNNPVYSVSSVSSVVKNSSHISI